MLHRSVVDERARTPSKSRIVMFKVLLHKSKLKVVTWNEERTKNSHAIQLTKKFKDKRLSVSEICYCE